MTVPKPAERRPCCSRSFRHEPPFLGELATVGQLTFIYQDMVLELPLFRGPLTEVHDDLKISELGVSRARRISKFLNPDMA